MNYIFFVIIFYFSFKALNITIFNHHQVQQKRREDFSKGSEAADEWREYESAPTFFSPSEFQKTFSPRYPNLVN